MVPDILAPIGPELSEVDRLVAREVQLRAGNFLAAVTTGLDDLSHHLHPALVILSARLFNYHPRPVLALACVAQFIYLATRVHFHSGEKPALPVLLGDLLYTKFFAYLCRHNVLEYLPPFSQVICDIHEGGTRREEWRRRQLAPSRQDYLAVIDKESGLLTARSCQIGARAAGAGAREQNLLADCGLNLGRAWRLNQEQATRPAAKEFASQALRLLSELPAQPEREALAALGHRLLVGGAGAERVMVG